MELSSLCHESLCWPTHRRRDAAQCLATRNANTAVPALLATPHLLHLQLAECADLYHPQAAVSVWRLCATSLGRPWPFSSPPRWLPLFPAAQLTARSPRLSHHAAVATQGSTPASPLRWALIQPFFRGLLHFRDSGPSLSLESRALPAAAPCGHLLGDLLGEPLRFLRLYQAHRRLPTPLRHLVGTSHSPLPCLASSGRATHLYAAWTRQPLHSSPHLVFT